MSARSSQVSQSEDVGPTSHSEDGTDLEVPETPLREPRDQTTQLTPVKRERDGRDGNTAVIQGSPSSSGIYDIDSVSGTIHTFSPTLSSVEDSQTRPETQAVQVQDVQATMFDEEEEERRVRDGQLREQSRRFVEMVAASIGQGGQRSAAKKPAAAARPKPSTKKKPAAKKPMQKKPSSAKQGVSSSKKPAAKVKTEAKKKPASCT